MKRAFSIVELMIVVAVLGILAAIVLPQYQSHATQARQAVAKNNLHTLRAAIELYPAQHKGIPPGYPIPSLDAVPGETSFSLQLTMATNASGEAHPPGTPGCNFGPYMPRIPENPFNDRNTVLVIANNGAVPAQPTGEYGWIYQPITKTIKLDWPGSDKDGTRYYDY